LTTRVFETERLRFRLFEPGDAADLERISADQLTRRYVGDGTVLNREQCEQWIRNSRDNVARHGYGTGAVVLRETGALIGWAGMARPGDGTEEVIYGLDRDYWGRGLGTELLGGLVAWARDKLALPELRATVAMQNGASIKMLLKFDFELRDECCDGDPETHLYLRSFR
jgi:ribosomal-protein-alanine N-acetyltransferase